MTNPDNLTINVREAKYDAANVYVSPINFYEIAIKITIGKAPEPKKSVGDFINESLLSNFIWLPLSANHIEAYTSLPFFDQHRDPFDRMILAIALADDLTVVSSDRNFPLYHNLINVLW